MSATHPQAAVPLEDEEVALNAEEIATRLRCSSRKVKDLAAEHGIGMQLGGRAGWRFTELDYRRLCDKLRPEADPDVVDRRRKRAKKERGRVA